MDEDLMINPASLTVTPSGTRALLRNSISDLSSRGLIVAAKWIAELLISVRPNDGHQRQSKSEVEDHDEMVIDNNSSTRNPKKKSSRREKDKRPQRVEHDENRNDLEGDREGEDEDEWEDQMNEHELDLYQVGKTYFDVKEYERAVVPLRSIRAGPGRFLCFYSQFLAIEKRLNDVAGPALGNQDNQPKFTTRHQNLLNDLQNSTEPFELYLKSILLSRAGYRLEAIDGLVHSINLYQYNWSAWKLLQKLIEGSDELETVIPKLPKEGFMNKFFFVHASLETYMTGNGENLGKVIAELKQLFPTSLFLKSQQALIAYTIRDFDTAETLFDEIYQEDPYRPEEVDTYSNILYVMEKKAKLTSLAQNYTGGVDSVRGDRMRPEVCCLLGNYWSLNGEHEKAIIEFRRALRLDPGYLSAWTLMGHEYVEMKNTYAAIESYRRAVDANAKDYRAWYGLGQTYEVLDMLNYSLYYYQQATALKPYDTRMWLALAQVYEKLGRRREARMTTKRALMNSQPNGLGGMGGGQEDLGMILKLAELYDSDGRPEEAAKYHKKFISQSMELEGGPTATISKSLLYLAKYEIDLSNAKEYLSSLVRLNVDEKEDAKILLRKISKIKLK
ncbi:hypothetical protein BY996DRAFT_6430610 [Phakopsora pachyrhizi]|nr:hypothetical protein BY996DRAFT_6430610 [Phakopsora pachyrhizi]